jgi:hypothetical protein
MKEIYAMALQLAELIGYMKAQREASSAERLARQQG